MTALRTSSDHREPDLLSECPKCYGTSIFPTPWIGFHAYNVACDCGAAVARSSRLPDEWRTEPGGLLGGGDHRLELLISCGRVAWVDEGIAADVRHLWEAGIWTFTSCQGGEQPRYVSLCDTAQVDVARPLLAWVVTVNRERGSLEAGR